jgi:hypothetical protein
MKKATYLHLVPRLRVSEDFPILFPMRLHNVLADTADNFIFLQVIYFSLQPVTVSELLE